MKTYRMNAVMAGALYFLGTVFGILGGSIGGEVLTSIIAAKPLAGVDMLDLVAAGAGSAALQSMGNVLYQFQDFTGPVGSIVFLIGATCFYIVFHRTRLFPRWLSVWGLKGKFND